MRAELREQIRQVLVTARAPIHVIGVAGSGMSSLALLLLQKGYVVSGSDLQRTRGVERLEEQGMVFTIGHTPSAGAAAIMMVYSSAIQEGNVERQTAQQKGILAVKRAELLAVLAEEKQAIVVGGMHGKTTSSSMLTHIWRVAGREPSYYIGAEVPLLGASAAWTSGADFVIEGDESDGTLTAFRPAHSLLLNIEEEHLDHYEDLEQILKVFSQFVENTAGHVIYCADDSNTFLLCSPKASAIGYGLSEQARYRATEVEFSDFSAAFTVRREGLDLGRIKLNLPGFQNVRNALGVTTLALELGVSFTSIQQALSEFRGASRRFEVKHKSEKYMVVDDYAHHPTEIEATLAAAKAGGWPRIIALFQPHRYSRTKLLLEDFARAFHDAEVVLLTEVYAASEAPIEGINGAILAEAIKAEGHARVIYEPDLQRLKRVASREIQEGDLVITLGAGNIHEVAAGLAAELDWFLALRTELSPEAKLVRNEPMSKHTTLRVGGPAQFWCEPATELDLQKALRAAHQHKIPVTLIGRGSNLLVRDGGIAGLCIHLGHKNFSQINIVGDRVEVGAGARLKTVVMEARKRGLGGLSFMEGIPGNIGGALRMNAGAMQGWMMEVVEEVRAYDWQGNEKVMTHSELEVRYRSVPFFESHIAVAAKLKGKPGAIESIDEELKSYGKKRWSSQPAAPSAGCIFKNPQPTMPAGKLIDELGLKNWHVGAARVSEVHGNFIVNEGGATATEVLDLIQKIKVEAKAKRGIELEPEVMILGENLS